MLVKAFNLAAKYHSGQLRKYTNEPYINHPMRVMLRVLDVYDDKNVLMASLLHDTLEDTSITEQEILDETNANVLEHVKELTNASIIQEHRCKSRAERKEIDREKIKKISGSARLIKVFDRTDNILDMPDKDFKKLYLEESLLLCDALEYREKDSGLLYEIDQLRHLISICKTKELLKDIIKHDE